MEGLLRVALRMKMCKEHRWNDTDRGKQELGAKLGTVRRNPKFFYITGIFKLCCDIASCRRDVASVTNKSECGTLV
jgi:hypothetical protein